MRPAPASVPAVEVPPIPVRIAPALPAPAPPPSGRPPAASDERTRPWALAVTPGAGQSVTVVHSHAVPGLGRWPAWLEVQGRATEDLRIGLAVLGRRLVLDVPRGARAAETAHALGAALELLLEAGGVRGFRAAVEGARLRLRPWRQG